MLVLVAVFVFLMVRVVEMVTQQVAAVDWEPIKHVVSKQSPLQHVVAHTMSVQITFNTHIASAAMAQKNILHHTHAQQDATLVLVCVTPSHAVAYTIRAPAMFNIHTKYVMTDQQKILRQKRVLLDVERVNIVPQLQPLPNNLLVELLNANHN